MSDSSIQKPITIRPADPDDAAALLEYIEKVSAESDNLTFGPGEFEMSLEEERQFLSNAAQRSNALFLVAVADGQIVGNLTFSAGHRPRIAHAGQLGITVLKDWWGRGIATQLIRELIQWSRGSGIRKINLRVRTDNERAIALYQKLGFRTEGVVTRDLRVKGEFYDVLLMGLCID